MGTKVGPNVNYDDAAYIFDAANIRSYSGTASTWFDLSVYGAACRTLTGIAFTGVGSTSYFNFLGGNSMPITGVANLNYGTGPRTVISWVYPTSNAGWLQILGFGTATSNAATGLAISNGTKWSTFQHNVRADEDGVATTNVWTHVAMTQSSLGSSIFINGSLVASFGSAITANQGAAYIGASFQGTEIWQGRINQVLFFNRQFTASDINKHFLITRGKFGV